MLSVSQVDNGPYVVDDGKTRHTFADPAAMRAFVAAYQALQATFPLDAFTLNDDGSIATWSGPDAQPANVAAVVAAWRAAQDQAAADTTALRARVVTLAQSAVGVQIDQLTAPQTRALLALLLYKQGAIDKGGAVRPLGEWT